MKRKDKNRDLEDLFRKEFSGYEFEPSSGFRTSFEKKLGQREFLRFNPGRFNIYYLGLAAVAAAALTASLLFFNTDSKLSIPSNLPEQAPETELQSEIGTGQRTGEGTLITGSKKGSPAASGRVTSTISPAMKSRVAVESKIKSSEEITGNESQVKEAVNNLVAESSPTTTILSRQAPSSLFSASTTEGCVPLTVTFANNSMNYDTCIWEFGDGGYSSLASPVWVFDEKGEYQVTLVTFGANGQNAVSRQVITVYPAPEARFEINGDDTRIPEEEVLFFNYSINAVSWEWDFGDGTKSSSFEPRHLYPKSGSYTVSLVARSEFGCVDSMSITNAFDDNSCFIRFPNAFIPNEGGPTGGYFTNRSDEYDEVFHPVWSGVTQYSLRIFSRMGILVFETADIDIGWDGYIKGKKAEPGVYIWKVRGQFKNGEPFVQAGDVTILPKR